MGIGGRVVPGKVQGAEHILFRPGQPRKVPLGSGDDAADTKERPPASGTGICISCNMFSGTAFAKHTAVDTQSPVS